MYNSLKIVKTLQYSFLYYPDGLTTGFAISKGYFSADEATGTLQIVEEGRAKRPSVLLANITIQDLTSGGAIENFTTLSNLQNRLVVLNCPLSVQVFNAGGGVQSIVPGTGISVNATDPLNPIINADGLSVKPTQTGTTYTLAVSDANSIIPFSNTGNKTVTFPTNATSAIPLGQPIVLQKIDGDGNTTLTVSLASGVTAYAPTGLVIKGDSKIWAVKIDTNKWVIYADVFFGLNSNVISTMRKLYVDGLYSLDMITTENGFSDISDTIQLLIDTGYSAWKSNKPFKYASDLSSSFGIRNLIDVGFVATRQLMVDANITPNATTTVLETSVDLTADRTVTLPSGLIAGKSITVIDTQQTVFKAGFKVKIKPPTGKTLNGITNGVVWLGYPGQSLTFICDGSGNYSYSVPYKVCVLEADSLELTTAFDGFIGLKIVKNTTTTDFNLATDFVFNSGTTGEFKCPSFDFDKHDIEAKYFNNKSDRGIEAGDDTDALTDPDSKFAVTEFGTANNFDHSHKIRIYVREQ